MDIARMKGLPQLPPNTHIYKEDTEAFEQWAKVKFEPGDLYTAEGNTGQRVQRFRRLVGKKHSRGDDAGVAGDRAR